MIDLIKKYKLNIGLALLAQSVSFLILFFILLKKKKGLAGAVLALSAIGGGAGAYRTGTRRGGRDRRTPSDRA